MVIISDQFKALLNWTQSPDPDTLKDILAALTDGDLYLLMTTLRGPQTAAAGRIAWAEFGRRAGFVDFEVRAVVLDGRVHVTFEGEAKPIHNMPILKVD